MHLYHLNYYMANIFSIIYLHNFDVVYILLPEEQEIAIPVVIDLTKTVEDIISLPVI